MRRILYLTLLVLAVTGCKNDPMGVGMQGLSLWQAYGDDIQKLLPSDQQQAGNQQTTQQTAAGTQYPVRNANTQTASTQQNTISAQQAPNKTYQPYNSPGSIEINSQQQQYSHQRPYDEPRQTAEAEKKPKPKKKPVKQKKKPKKKKIVAKKKPKAAAKPKKKPAKVKQKTAAKPKQATAATKKKSSFSLPKKLCFGKKCR
ncbi:hypothetical protein [Candidatus Albibeggiatoa sp. nov. NOAA]|uniref:lipoprotein n=1 Tax=Candidatus Albibeggiatoa sp. nov. NOAA TaxID=3162724 RepID=UPI0032FB86F9|nr:hypothetical protein [Thiotrichaceae bacterium]